MASRARKIVTVFDLVVVESRFTYRLVSPRPPGSVYGMPPLRSELEHQRKVVLLFVAGADRPAHVVRDGANPDHLAIVSCEEGSGWDEARARDLVRSLQEIGLSKGAVAFGPRSSGATLSTRDAQTVARLANAFCHVHEVTDVAAVEWEGLRVAWVQLDEEGG